MTSSNGTDNVAVTKFREYLRIKTVQPKPDYESCKTFLENYGRELGADDCVEGKPFTVVTFTGSKPQLKSLMLYSHTDVVPVFEEHWKYDPFEAHKDSEGNIYARGAQDMKCLPIQQLEAIRRLKQSKNFRPLRTIHVVFGPDEEIGGDDGMVLFRDHPMFKVLNVGFVMDEGVASTDDIYRLYYAERFVWWIKVTCRGQPGHGSKFIEDNVGEKFRKVINQFLSFRDNEETRLKSDPNLTLGDVVTVNLTKIQGGVQMNVVPAEMTAYFDVRVSPKVDADKLLVQIKSWLTEAGGDDVTLEFLQFYKDERKTDTSKANPWWNALLDSLEKLGLKYKSEIFLGATDSRFLRERGYLCVGFSPMINTPQLLHDHNEFLNEKVFLSGVEIFTQLLPAMTSVTLDNDQ